MLVDKHTDAQLAERTPTHRCKCVRERRTTASQTNVVAGYPAPQARALASASTRAQELREATEPPELSGQRTAGARYLL